MNTKNELLQEIEQLEKELQTVGDRNEHMRISNLINEKREELSKLSLEQAHEERVTTAVGQFDQLLASLNLGGMSLREVIGGESEYQLVSIELKKVFATQADNFSQQINDLQTKHADQERASLDREEQLQRQNENLQSTVRKLQVETEENGRLLSQERLERAHAEQARDNAVKQLDEHKAEIDRLKSHIDDLRKEIAVGASAAIKVVDTEEEEREKKALAEKIRRERTVYNRDWVDPIRKDRYKAYLAVSGEEITYPWTEQSKYFVIPESEVPQFRQQYASEQQSVEPVHGVDKEPVQGSDITGGQFQKLPAPEVAAISTTRQQLDQGTPRDTGAVGSDEETPVTRREFEELKGRVEALELGKGAVA
ncbi:hypothetical protein DVH26_07720 [Paenibacillus sp. H1-7]|uniref:hypothetical protein n=1 Tax=Paenibacillus sp. H1-7 TaxID=2282849 RepID=UPI001EF8643C|nr:hypothetical protein [Paenibacillus sp. H1-7]ULL14346.1 hypothetical protein DVH26_07720 [Paenibacillus sp. H1-7]